MTSRNARSAASLYELDRAAWALGVLPLSHSYGLTVMNAGNILGTRAVLLRWFNPEGVLEAIARFRVQSMSAVPTMLVYLLHYPDAERFDTSSMRLWGSGAAPLPLEIVEPFEKRFGGRILEGYGLTEASPVVSAHRLSGVRKLGSVGPPIPGVEVRIHDDDDRALPAGELVAVLGPSGSGKSTILRMICGLETPDEGEIYLTGENATSLSIQKRGVGFVFQHYALFKHMTVWQNIAFGLEVQKFPKKEIQGRVEELLHLVQLQGYADHLPAQLSGGQRQRVALARALAPKPKVLLLDEPFGALDAKVREELRNWIRRLHDEFHVTSLFVTHDQNEALEISDKIVVVNQGRVEQIGTSQEIYENPQSSFVAGFIGPVNVLRGKVEAGKAKVGEFEFLNQIIESVFF